MRISRESRKLARELFRLACHEGTFSADRARQIADALLAKRPRGTYGALREFTRLVRLELARHHASITSAAPLSDPERAKLTTSIRERFGPQTTLSFQVASSLIGGLRIQVGSDVWDGSLQAKLQDLKNQF